MGCSQGSQAQLAVDAETPFDDASEYYDFLYEDLARRGSIINPNTITGTRSSFADLTREGAYLTQGRLATNMSQYDLDNWLPRILGAAESTDVFNLAESVPEFQVLIDRVGAVFQYTDCKVDKAIWRGRAGPGDERAQLVEQVLEIMGKEEDSTVSWPGTLDITDLVLDDNRHPYACVDATLTIDATPYEMKNFAILVDNHLEPRWVTGGSSAASLAPSDICAGDRTIMLRAGLPFSAAGPATAALYNLATQLDGTTSTLVFDSGNDHSTTFTFTGLQWTKQSPAVKGKQEIVAYFDFFARKTSVGTDELVVTNENTP